MIVLWFNVCVVVVRGRHGVAGDLRVVRGIQARQCRTVIRYRYSQSSVCPD